MAVSVTTVSDASRQRHDRMIEAFARSASSIAWQGPLQAVLDQLAREACVASAADMCTVSICSRFHDTFEMVGASGCPPAYHRCLEQARSLGAPLLTVEAFRTGRSVVGDVDTMVGDSRLAPLLDLARQRGWVALAAVPLSVRGEVVGAMTAFYTRENRPEPSDIAFLTAMADHGALAVHTARLAAEMRDKAALEERAHVARDLHDAISQLLFSMQLRVRALQLEAAREDAGPRLSDGLGELGGVIARAVDEMRALILHLRPAELREHALVPALQQLGETVRAREGVAVTVRAVEGIPPLKRPDDEQIYRIVQEAIGNAISHADAGSVRVEVTTAADMFGEVFIVEVVDDGHGFDATEPKPGHVGLANMRARCAELGGRLTIDSSPQGTTVRIEVPLGRIAE